MFVAFTCVLLHLKRVRKLNSRGVSWWFSQIYWHVVIGYIWFNKEESFCCHLRNKNMIHRLRLRPHPPPRYGVLRYAAAGRPQNASRTFSGGAALHLGQSVCVPTMFSFCSAAHSLHEVFTTAALAQHRQKDQTTFYCSE